MEKFLISCLESRVESDGVLYGRYLFGPLPRGQGATIGTALRRSLLSNLTGLAITAVEILGVDHEYSVVPGARESVIDVILNLKKLVFTSTNPRRKRGIGYISVRGPGTVTGHDLRLPPGLQCVNPDELIATVAANGYVNLKIIVSTGKNYVVHKGVALDAQDKRKLSLRKTTHRTLFLVDAVFMPVRRANFVLQSDEDIRPFPLDMSSLDVSERVLFEIWTNGTLTPGEAMNQAATELIRTFSLLQTYRRCPPIFLDREPDVFLNKDKGYALYNTYPINAFLDMDIGILPVTPTTLRAFKDRNIDRLQDLLEYSYEALLSIPGITPELVIPMLCHLRAYGVELKPKAKTLLA